jgi:hypothetical protein
MITDVTTVLIRDFAGNMQGRIERLNPGESAEPAAATAATPTKGFSLGMRAALIALSRVLLRGARGRASCHDQKPRAADRARPSQRDRGRLCRHAVVGPTDIAAPAVHLMTNIAITGATFDIDGGQQLIEG